jgi:hypothetical protein
MCEVYGALFVFFASPYIKTKMGISLALLVLLAYRSNEEESFCAFGV